MYISKIELQKGIPSSRVRQLHFRSYQPHREIWRIMSQSETMARNFVYRLDTDSGTPVWHIVSEQPPADDLGVWDIKTKAYNPVLTSGMRLSFSLRANPVKTQSESENKKKHRFDVVIDARYHLKEKGIPKEEWPSAEQLTLQHSLAWLQKRAESFGFAIEEAGDGYSSVLVEHHEQQRFKKKQHDVTLSVVDYRGVLHITNPELFREKLFRGIGHGKAFGCGLLLVRRA